MEGNIMKFSKYNRRRRKHTLPPKSQYIPTMAELDYCKSMDITPSYYVDLKYERAKAAKEEI